MVSTALQPAVSGRPGPLIRAPDYAERRFLPLARRRLMIFRPDGLAIRFRKPWFRLRLILLG
jgi:hypothetical protein